MNAHTPLTADPVAVRAFAGRLHAHAAVATAGLHDPGMLQLVRVFPDGAAAAEQYAIGEVDHMVDEAVRQSNAGFNVYVEARTVRKRARGERGRGDASDTVAVFGLVADDDADKGKGSRIEAAASLVIESSPGNTHRWFLTSPAIPADRAKRIGAGLKAKVGGDSDTGVITQPFRVAGTVNFPSRSKVARGRVATPTAIVSLDGPVWTPDELEAAFPPPKPRAKARPNASSAGETGSTGRASPEAEALAAETNVPKRWTQFFAAARAAYADGLSPDDFETLIRRHPDGCGGKFLEPYDRLRREVERAWDFIQAKADGVADAPAEPTYADASRPIGDARGAVEAAIERFVEAAAAYRLSGDDEAEPPVHGLIAQKAVAEWLRGAGLPAGVAVEHYNNVAGLDRYRDVRGLMVIGRTVPAPAAVKALAGALTGREGAIPPDGQWYAKAVRGIRLRDGSPVGVECDAHPDPIAEACRWQICEGELMQALGRARGVNRTARTPLAIDVLADVCLPLTVDDVERWTSPGEEVEMLADGVVLDSPNDMVAAWPAVWPTSDSAKQWLARRAQTAGSDRNTVPNPYKNSLYIGIWHRVRPFRYQRAGPKQKWRTGAHCPVAVPEPRAWLESRLGPLAGFAFVEAAEPPRPKPGMETQP